MKRVLMVCLGNICRSPLAEAILQSKVTTNTVFVDSAGTGAYHLGNPPDIRSIEIALENGLDIKNQKARQFTVKDFINFDIIYAMDINNYNDILTLAKSHEDKLKVKLVLNELYPSLNKSVPDPYYGGSSGFKKVYNMLDEACEVIASKLEIT